MDMPPCPTAHTAILHTQGELDRLVRYDGRIEADEGTLAMVTCDRDGAMTVPHERVEYLGRAPLPIVLRPIGLSPIS